MEERFIDLHTHSNCSDGSMSPSELVIHAAENNLAAIALTDHDTVSGIAEALAQGKKSKIEVVPAIEFSAKSDTETHILGFFIDTENGLLKATLKKIVEERNERNEMTAKLLKKLGFDVSLEEVSALAPGGFIGRAHFARVMMNKGYVASVKEGFDKYLATGRPAFYNNQTLEAQETIEVIHACGGAAFVAHPHLIRLDDDALEIFLKELKGYGLDGIEGYYTDYDAAMQEKIQAMAKRLELNISGGTDFHAKMKPHISIGKGLGNMAVPYSVLENIKAIVNR